MAGKNTERKKTTYSLTIGLLLSAASLLFCWFYGIPALAAGIIGLKKIFPFRAKAKGKNLTAKKVKWGLYLAVAGIAFSGFFTVYYLIAVIGGAVVRL